MSIINYIFRNRNISLLEIILLFIALLSIVIFTGGLLTYYLWNALIPSITGWRTINFGEAMGLFIFAKILTAGTSYSRKE